ncbi:uncharacterized protein LOC132750211 [Ruditapes philippinarum]|uniref:uncharacterized protein LOC132750211 n=1 Tax=Ruditapes philippinarum TaxID=129788 RepID=UPI00295AFB6B|nr:uncharacterized protein LOC132750211 [Ruditapes philippinarum]
MGKRVERRGMDGLRWYEILMCCCKCRAECKSCVVIMLLYYIPIILLLALTAACITIGAIWRTDCSYQSTIPYWVIASSLTPYPLFICVKGIAEDYYGITFSRSVSLTYHVMFTAWLILGSSWIFDMWMKADDSNCDEVLRYFSFCLVLVHWFLFLLSTIGQIVIMAKICCCGAENAIKPLKGNINIDGDDLELGK